MKEVVTYEQYLQMPEAECKEECVDGEIIEIPTAKWDHEEVVHRLQMALMDGLDFRLVIDGYIHSAPELVAEVLSPTEKRKDMVRRIEDYESLGVLEFWIMSPEARNIE